MTSPVGLRVVFRHTEAERQPMEPQAGASRVQGEWGLNLPRRKKRRLPDRPRQPLDAPEVVNHIWSLDFMSDALYSGKRFRTLNIIDDGVREVLNIVIDTSIPGGRVVRTLEQLAQWRGLPKALRMDNGPELLSHVLVQWCESKGIELRYIQPGKPNQNAFIERFNKTYPQRSARRLPVHESGAGTSYYQRLVADLQRRTTAPEPGTNTPVTVPAAFRKRRNL